MPKEAIKLGGVDVVTSLENVSTELLLLLEKKGAA
jgi:chemotaxis response regulator CheB